MVSLLPLLERCSNAFSCLYLLALTFERLDQKLHIGLQVHQVKFVYQGRMFKFMVMPVKSTMYGLPLIETRSYFSVIFAFLCIFMLLSACGRK